MKRVTSKIGFCILLLFAQYTQSSLKAQTVSNLLINTVVPTSILVCEGKETFVLTLTNTSVSSSMKDMTIAYQLPDGFVYAGEIGGADGSAVTYLTSSLANKPSFTFAASPLSFSAGATMSFSFKANATCQAITSYKLANPTASGIPKVKNFVNVEYFIGAQSFQEEKAGGTNSYNLLFADLNVLIDGLYTPLVGYNKQLITRQFKVKNTGFGKTSKLTISLLYETGLKHNFLKLNGQTLIPSASSTLTQFVYDITNFSAATYLGVPATTTAGFFDTDEELVFVEEVQPTTCDPSLSTTYNVSYGCNEQKCNMTDRTETFAFINAADGSPRISTELLTDVTGNLCTNNTKLFKYKFTSVGLNNNSALHNSARDLSFRIYQKGVINSADFSIYINGVKTSFASLGIQSNYYLNGYPYDGNFQNKFYTLNNQPALYQQNIDGPGGLEDLDNDGYFDDLKTNDFIEVSFEATYSCPISSGCGSVDNYYAGIYVIGSSSCTNSLLTLSDPQEYRFQIYGGNSGTITGKADIVNLVPSRYQFSLDKGINYFNFTCTDNTDNYFAIFTLPLGYSLADFNDVKWYDNATTFERIDASKITYNASLRLLRINFGKKSGYYDLPIVLNCSSAAVPESADLFWTMYYSCLTNCSSCIIPIACNRITIYNHCPYCTNGLTTSSFNVDRTTLGWPEPLPSQPYTYGQWSALSRLTNTAGLALDRGFEYDDLNAVAIGQINGNNYNQLKLEVEYTAPSNQIAEMLKVIDYSISINNVVCATSTTLPTIVVTGKTVRYTFDIPASCRNNGATYASGSEVKVKIHYLVNEVNSIFNIPNNDLSNFRARYFAKTAIGAYETCESFGDNFSVIKYYDYNDGNGVQGRDMTCDVFPDGSYAVFFGAGGTRDYFPNEFRPYAIIESSTVTIPTGFAFNTANSFYFNDLFDRNPITSFTQSGNVYSIQRQNNWIMSEQSFVDGFNYTLNPICKPFIPPLYSASSTVTFTKYINALNPLNKQTITYNQYNNNRDNFTTNLKVFPDEFQEGYSSEVQWPIQVCNQGSPATATATSTYIALEPPANNIDFKYALDINDVQIPVYKRYNNTSSSKNAIFVIGDIPKGSCKYIKVVASYTNCVEDKVETIKTYVNSVCGASPVPLNRTSGASCRANDIVTDIFLKYKTTDFIYEIIPLTAQPVDICAPIKYRVKYKSTGYADVSNLKFGLRLPVGADFKPGSFSILYNGSTYSNVNFTTVDNSSALSKLYTWDLSSIQPLSANTPSGNLIGFRAINKDVLTFEFELFTDCNFNPGQKGDNEDAIKFKVEGNTNCGRNINDFFDQYIKINGFDPLDDMEVVMTSNANQFGSDNKAVLSIQVRNTGSVILGQNLPAVNRYLRLRMPAGINFESSTQGSPVKLGVPIIGGSGSKYYYWAIPPLAPGQTQNYQMVIRLLGFNTSRDGNIVPINASSVMANQGSCILDASLCELEAVTAFDVVNLIIPTDFCENCIPRFAPIPGKKYLVSAWVKESNSPIPTQYNNVGIKLLFEGPEVTVGPYKPKGEIIDGWQRIEAEFLVPENTSAIQVLFENYSATNQVFFDDVRIHPYNSNMKSFVYDPYSLRLAAELDENNYATFYEYDEEGGLIRVKKETEKGVMTIQESRSNTSKK